MISTPDSLRSQHIEYLERVNAGDEIPYLDYQEWLEMRVMALEGERDGLASGFARIPGAMARHVITMLEELGLNK
jgi:hypothetical protein